MTTRTVRPARRRQRGQILPIVALCAVALLGAAALAIDLSLQTHDQRTLQNTTDAASLAGAADLPVNVVADNQFQAATDALQVIRNRMQWENLVVGGGSVTNSVWASDLASGCSSAVNTTTPPSCNITKTVCTNTTPAPSDLPATCDSKAALSNNAHFYSITVQTPAISSDAVNAATDLHNFEVTMTQDSQNYIAGVLGRATSTQGSRSTAYHFGANQPFGFALFAKTVVQTQNKSTTVVGDTYADRNVAPQSNGQAGFCASNGLVILGSPQKNEPTAGTDPNDGQVEITPFTGPVQTLPNCDPQNQGVLNSTNAGTVNQTRNPANGCGVPGTTFTYVVDPTVGACVADPPLSAPTEPAPELTNPGDNYTCVNLNTTGAAANPGNYSCTGNNKSALTVSANNVQLAPGVYVIAHNPNCTSSCYDVDISNSMTINRVTFWLQSGARLRVHGNNTTVSINPAPPVLTGSPGDGRYPIYSPPGSNAEVFVQDNGANLDLDGTLYLPDGTAHTTSNAWFQILGQAIVGTWDDRGGNHPTADITYDGQRNAPQNEVLKLVQ